MPTTLYTCPHCENDIPIWDISGAYTCPENSCREDLFLVSCDNCQELNLLGDSSETYTCTDCGNDIAYDENTDAEETEYLDVTQDIEDLRNELADMRSAFHELQSEVNAMKVSTSKSLAREDHAVTEAVKKEIEHLKDIKASIQGLPSRS